MGTARKGSIPTQERAWHVVMAVVLLSYGGIGLYFDDLYIPGKHSRGVHLHGAPAWVMFGAFVCAALNLVAVVADHCDSSDGEKSYPIAARVTQVAGWALFIGALALSFFPGGKRNW